MIACVRVLVGLVVGCVVLAAGCGSESSGYTPEERAAQLVMRYEKVCQQGDQQGDRCPSGQAAPAKITCEYQSDAGNGYAWYLCNPGGYHVSCLKATTDGPLEGPQAHPYEWGDCDID